MDTLTQARSLWPLHSGLTRDFDELWSRFLDWIGSGDTSSWNPRVDILEKPHAYVAKAEVPGMRAEDIQVTLSGDTLTIQGEKRAEETEEHDKLQVTERTSGTFVRTFHFDKPVTEDSVEAHLREGILSVSIAKAAETKATKIKVQSE